MKEWVEHNSHAVLNTKDPHNLFVAPSLQLEKLLKLDDIVNSHLHLRLKGLASRRLLRMSGDADFRAIDTKSAYKSICA